MFIVSIAVSDQISADQHEALFTAHVEWFKKYFAKGQFVMIGPYADRERAGVIIAQTESREELMQILEQDSYYPNLASYEVSEFIPKMIAEDLEKLQHV